jgi:hypothetical protein
MPPSPGFPGAAGTTRWVRPTCATCPGTTIRHPLAIWAARSRAYPCDRAARAAAVCGSATSSRVVPSDRSSSYPNTVRRLPGHSNGFAGSSYSGPSGARRSVGANPRRREAGPAPEAALESATITADLDGYLQRRADQHGERRDQ